MSEEIKKEENNLSDQRDVLNSNLNEVDQKYAELVQNIDDEISVLSGKVVRLDTDRRSLSDELASDKARLSNIDIRIEEYNNRKKCLEVSIETYEKKIEELNNQELYYNNEKQNIQDRLDVISKMITLANRDFRGYLLSNVVEYIDGVTKEYSSRVFGSPCVSFSLDGNLLNTQFSTLALTTTMSQLPSFNKVRIFSSPAGRMMAAFDCANCVQ